MFHLQASCHYVQASMFNLMIVWEYFFSTDTSLQTCDQEHRVQPICIYHVTFNDLNRVITYHYGSDT